MVINKMEKVQPKQDRQIMTVHSLLKGGNLQATRSNISEISKRLQSTLEWAHDFPNDSSWKIIGHLVEEPHSLFARLDCQSQTPIFISANFADLSINLIEEKVFNGHSVQGKYATLKIEAWQNNFPTQTAISSWCFTLESGGLLLASITPA